jgi:endonuclease/exonuclease/phosphatase family metal-dependent hydrolase
MTNNTNFTLAALLASAIAAPAGAGTPPPVPLRVIAYNVLTGIGNPGSPEANAIGKFITTQDVDGAGPNMGLAPDIVCFQEMNQSQTSQVTNFRNTFLPGYDLRTATGDGFNYNATLIRPGITVISHSSLGVGGPRGVGKTRIRVPGALRDAVIYNAHFKCCADGVAQRTTNANSSGNNVSFEYFNNNVNVIFAGDLNSNNNSDGTLTGLFFTSTNPGVSSGVLNLAVETLAGAANPGVTNITTYPPSSRLDYICLDEQLASFFDADMSGTYTQTERNAMGFVYYSGDDAGLRSNGDATATNSTSDHRPVVFDAQLPRDPNVPYFEPADADQSGSLDIDDLYLWEQRFAATAPPLPSTAADIDGDRNVDPEDRTALRGGLRGGEIADISIF